MRETEINRDATPFFFLQPVGIDSSQSFHEGGLAMVDVPGGSYNDRFHLAEILP